MKTFKRIQALVLAAIMAVMTFGTTTAFAAEPMEENTMVVTAEEATFVEEENNQVSPAGLFPDKYSDNFYCGGGVRGNNFKAEDDNLSFTVTYWDAESGQILPNGVVILAVRLYDNTAGNVLAQEWQGSNGYVYGGWNVTPGHTYHFEYLIAYGNRGIYINNEIKIS